MVTSSSPDISHRDSSDLFKTTGGQNAAVHKDLPTLDGCEHSGDALALRGKHADAIAEFKRALLLLGAERGRRRATLYVKLGDASRALNNRRVAVNNYIKALSIEALDEHAYRRAVELLTAEHDFVGVDELHRRRIDALDVDGDKLEIWRQNAELWLDLARDLKRGITALTELLALRPDDVDARFRLAAAQEGAGQIEQAIETRGTLAELLDAAQAAAVLKRAAELARDELKDSERAVALCAQALLADAEREEVLEMAEQLLEPAQAWTRLADTYQLVLDGSNIVDRQVRAARKLGRLCREHLRDLPRAEQVYVRAVQLRADDADLHRSLAEVRDQQGQLASALDACRSALSLAPRDADAYHLAYGILDKSGLTDSAFNAASVLDYLGEADINESVVADVHRPEGLLAAQGALGDDYWQRRLLYPDKARKLDDPLCEILPAAVQAELELLRIRREQVNVDESERQDLESSTATMMRALLWAARLLGIAPPTVYVSSNASDDIEPVVASEPSLRVNRALGSGLELKQLAFLWGRGLCIFRPESYLGAFYPTPEKLGALLGVVAGSASRVSENVKPLELALEKHLEPKARERLRKTLRRIKHRRAAAKSWLVSVELASTRAGLLCCGDIAQAAELIERYPFGKVTTAAEQLDDLLVWSVSDQYAELRRAIGVAVSG